MMSYVRRFKVILFCVVLLSIISQPLLAADDGAAPLPVDPAISRGTLANGVTYWVRSHATPPGKITFWMHVDTGSLNEADGQEGLAHYLEHLAFNGTQHFPPGALVKYFESLGLRFGQHQNAFTNFTQTTYTLTLPNTQEETLHQGLLYLADVAFGMLLTPEEIDKERRVILEEKRSRKGASQRLMEKLLPELLPGMRVVRRLPIGLEETIARVQRDDFLAYYTTWYHPAKVTILAAGDVPVETIVAAITGHFAAWQRDDAPPVEQRETIQPLQAPRPVVLTDPEVTTAGLEMFTLRPRTPRLTVADLRRHLVERLGTWMVNRRLEQRIQEGKAPYQTAQTRQRVFLSIAEEISAEADAAPASWAEALTGLMVEVQRARLHGFTSQELDIARRALLAAAEHAAQTEPTQDAQAFVGAMNQALSARELPRSAAQHLQLLQQLLPGVTREEVAATFTANFDPQRSAYILSLPEQEGLAVPSREDLLAVVQQALAQPVDSWQGQERPTALLDREPQPGTIAEQTRFAPLQVTQVTLANHVRVHYRFMDFKKDHVTVTITLPGGVIRERPEQRGITEVAALALSHPATSTRSSTDIRDLMTGKKVTLDGRVTEDALVLTVTGAPEALADGLRLVYLLLLEAKIEPARVALWQHQKLQDLAALRSNIGIRARNAATLLLSGQDPRRAPLTPEQVKARAEAIPQAQEWLNALLRAAPMEVAIVGDIPETQALELAATYLGSLPPRPRQDASLPPLRQIPVLAGPVTQTLEVETITPRAYPILLWRSADWPDVRGRRLMFMAVRILERRLRQELREERGLTYSTATFAQPSKIYPGTSALYVEFATDPGNVTEAAAIARAVVERFAAEGPTDEEIETARKQTQNTFETMLKEPQYWVGLLADLEYHGTKLEDVHHALEAMLAFTRVDITAELQKTVVPERFGMILARPKSPTASSATPQGQGASPPAVQ